MQNKILETLKKEKPFLEKEFGVTEIGLFGSHARGDAKEDSDVDILISLREIKYSLLAGAFIYLEQKLKRKIDLIRRGPHLSSKFLSKVEKDIIYV